MDYIFIEKRKDTYFIGIIKKARLIEFYIEEDGKKGQVGNIYRGKVDSVVSGINSAFIKLGHGKNGYLFVKDAYGKEDLDSNNKKDISQILKENDDVIVQIVKEGTELKGPKLTSHITIPGNYLILTPYSNKVTVSRKIDHKTREKMREFGNGIKKDDIGFIMRTNSKYIKSSEIISEYDYLISIYKRLEKEKNFLPSPKLLYKDMGMIYKLLNSEVYKNYSIVVNDKQTYEDIMELNGDFVFEVKDRLKLKKDFNFEYNQSIVEDLKEALSKKVKLDNGGFLVIEETEAFTVVDVNSGKYTKGNNLNETIMNINRSALIEILRQVRLRNVSGIILIDFIDFRDKESEKDFLLYLKKELLEDANNINFIDITKLGLVEMTRKKTRDSDLKYFYKKCPNCQREYKKI